MLLKRFLPLRLSAASTPRDLRLRTLATSRPPEQDYEIDYISLQKKKKLVTLAPPPPTNKAQSYSDFILHHFADLMAFQRFVMSSYKPKRILSFKQLTNIEVLNSLYIYKRSASNKTFVKLLLAYLSENTNSPHILSQNLAPLLELVDDGMLKFSNEVTSLSREFDFTKLQTFERLASQLDSTLREFDHIIDVRQQHSYENNAGFFKILVQFNRYKQLQAILLKHPLKSLVELLAFVRENPHQAVAEPQLLLALDTIAPYYQLLLTLNLIGPIVGYTQLLETVAPRLYQLANDSSSHQTVKLAASKVLNTLLPLFYNGDFSPSPACEDYVKKYAASHIHLQTVVSFGTNEHVRNYEISELYNHDLLDHLNHFRLLSGFMGKPFYQLKSITELFTELDALTAGINNKDLKQEFSDLKTLLTNFQSAVPWTKFAILDDLVEDTVLVKDIHDTLAKYDPTVANILEMYQPFVFDEEKSVFDNFKDWLGSGFNSLEYDTLLKCYKNFEHEYSIPSLQSQEAFKILKKSFGSGNENSSYYIEQLNLNKFTQELKTLKNYTLGSKEFKLLEDSEVLASLDGAIDAVFKKDILNFDNSPINHSNVVSYVRLRKALLKLFNSNNGDTECLDQLLLESSGELTYVQIPDSLKLDAFTKDLEIFRDSVLGGPFGQFEAKNIVVQLENAIDRALHNRSTTSKIDYANAHRFIKLKHKLISLFSINGGHSGILDTLLHSQGVFEQFEKAKLLKQSAQPYKQIPNDFKIEEYLCELIQLKNALGANFSHFSTSEILDKVNELKDNETQADKVVVWRKLHGNLSYLFKYNNDNSFVLDSVLVNADEFKRFESHKAIEKSTSDVQNSWVGENSRLINEYFTHIEKFLSTLRLVEKEGIWNISEAKFDKLLKRFKLTLDERAYDYPIYLSLLDQLKTFNSKIEYYPSFLQQLYEIKSNSDKKLGYDDVEAIYKAFIENVEYEPPYKTQISIPIDESKSQKFDLNTFLAKDKNELDIEELMKLKSEYNDSEKLISLLTRQEDSVELENNGVLRKIADSEDVYETELKGALATSFKEPAERTESAAKEHGSIHHRSKPVPVQQSATDTEIDTSNLENFMKKAKKEQDMIKESKFREREAFEWSKTMVNTHRSIDSRNFFNPISSDPDGRLLFPSLDEGDRFEYLVITVDGKVTPTTSKEIGPLPQEDTFRILNKFDKKDIKRFTKLFKRFLKQDWKLVASKLGPNEKYLILGRDRMSKFGRVFGRIKSFFALTGLVLVSLVGLNLWFDEADVSKKSIPPPPTTSPPPPAAIYGLVPVQGPVDDPVKRETSHQPQQQPQAPESGSVSWWKKLIWATK